MKKPKRQKVEHGLTRRELREIEKVIDDLDLDRKYGSQAEVLLHALMIVKGFDDESRTELVRRIMVALRGERVDEYGSPKCGHA